MGPILLTSFPFRCTSVWDRTPYLLDPSVSLHTLVYAHPVYNVFKPPTRPKILVPDSKNVSNHRTRPHPVHTYDTLHTSFHRAFLMKSFDNNFINGANPGGARNGMEIAALSGSVVGGCQRPGSSENVLAWPCGGIENKIYPLFQRFRRTKFNELLLICFVSSILVETYNSKPR